MESTLSALPTEIILELANQLDYESELNALSQFNRRFHRILGPVLYWPTPNNCTERKAASPLRGCVIYALEWAVANGVESTARKALSAGAKPSAYLAAKAARNGYAHLVELLYSYKGSVDLDVPSHQPVAHRQAYPGCRFIDASDPQGTPLREAASRGHRSIVRMLLAYGADINGGPGAAADALGSPLAVAAWSGDLPIVMILVDSGADKGFYHRGLSLAAKGGHTEVVRFLVEKGASVDRQGPRGQSDSPFLNAARSGHIDIVSCLLDHGAGQGSPDSGMRAFRAAVQSRNRELVKLLVRHFNYPRAARDGTELTAVACAAAGCGSVKILEEAISLGWKVTSPPIRGFSGYGGSTPLAVASEGGHVGIVRRLLMLGADPNGGRTHHNDEDENTDITSPLVAAIQKGHSGIVFDLLDHRADIRLVHVEVEPILLEAVPHEAIFRVLIEKGRALKHRSDREILDVTKEAIRQNRADQVELLIEHSVDFALADRARISRECRLAVLLALSNETVLGLLLENGYTPQSSKNPIEDDIIRCAVDYANIPLLQYLISRGSKTLQSPSPQFQATLIRRALKAMSPKANPTSAEELLDFLLLQQGFDIESLNDKDETLLLAVVQHQHSERATRLLIERGANPCFHQSASGGLCPLVASVRKRTCDTCKEFSTWLPRDWFRGNCTNPYTFQIVLQGMAERGIPWNVVEPQLRDAIATAERDGADGDVMKALRK